MVNENNEIVIQINGKKRSAILINKEIKEEELTNEIKNNNLIDKYLKDGEIVKTIYVKGRLINFIIK